MLSQDDYYLAGKLTQFVSVDLLVKHNEKFLMGKRVNQPAKGYWFNPGGKVYKNESIKEALKRVLKNEVGLDWNEVSNCEFIAPFEHVYSNNFRDNSYETHYVSMAYILKIKEGDIKEGIVDKIEESMKLQHEEIKWFSLSEILSNNEVHKFVKNFFELNPDNKVE